MARDIEKSSVDIFMPEYPDIVPTHPDWTDEDYERHIREEMEKVKDLDWPDI